MSLLSWLRTQFPPAPCGPAPVASTPPARQKKAAPAPEDNYDRTFERILSNGRKVIVQARPGSSYEWIRITDPETGKVLFDEPCPAMYGLRFCLPVDLEQQIDWGFHKYDRWLQEWAREARKAEGPSQLEVLR